LRYSATTLVLVLLIAAAAAAAITIGQATAQRIDVTATRAHSLSPRTAGIIDRLDTPHELILSASLASLSSASAQSLLDLLATFDESSDLVRVTVIDSGRASAPRELGDVIQRLSERYEGDLDAHESAVATASAAMQRLADELPTLAASLRDVGEEIPEGETRRALVRQAEVYDTLAADAATTQSTLDSVAATAFLDVPLPEADRALEAVADPSTRLVQAVDTLAAQLSAIESAARQAGDDAMLDWLSTTRRFATSMRDAALRAVDALRTLEPLEPLRIARLLTQQQALLVLGDTGPLAIDVSQILPQQRAGDAAAPAAQVVVRGEERIATALAASIIEHPPVLVLVHAERQRLLDNQNQLIPGARATLGAAVQRARQRRADIREWAVALDPQTPDPAALDPTGGRPIVWFVLGPPSFGEARRYERVVTLAASVQRLVRRGESLLVTLSPTNAPTGEPDPFASFLPDLGLAAETGRPIVRLAGPNGPVAHQHILRTANTDHPLGPALNGRATLFQWPSAIRPASDADSDTFARLLTLEGGPRTWGSARWLAIAQGAMRATPRPLPERDLILDEYPVVATVERRSPDAEAPPQRAVIVGAPLWYSTDVLLAQQQSEGRAVATYPGNALLLDHALAWLAHHDELIPDEPATRDIPRIAAIEPGRLQLIRWLLALGIPLAILALGAMLKLIRR